MIRPALCVAVVALAGCGGGDTVASKPAPTPTATVDESIPTPPPTDVESFKGKSLSERDSKRFARTVTHALRTRDERAFVKLLDPRRPGVVAQQRTWFRNVLAVPMRRRAVYLVGNRANIDSSGKRELTADLGFEHQITGVDPRPVAEWYRYGFRKRNGRTVISSVTGAAPDETSADRYSRYYRQAWDDGAMAGIRHGRAVLLGPASDRALLSSLAASADQAIGAETGRLSRLGLHPRRDGFAITLQSPKVADLFAYFGGYVNRNEAQFDAFAPPVYATDRVTGEVRIDRPVVTTRIVLARDKLGDDLPGTLRHELVHALFAQVGNGAGVPPWIVEGAAVYLSDPPAAELAYRRARGREGLAAGGVLPTAGFYSGGADAIARSYGMGYLAIAYLADRDGERALVRRLVRVYQGKMSTTAFQGASAKAFAAKVRAWSA